MTTEAITSITLNIPVGLYKRLEQQALKKHHTVEDEVLQAVVRELPLPAPQSETVPLELTEKLAAMELLDEVALRRAAQGMSPRRAAQLRALNDKRQREGFLTSKEIEQQFQLLREYEQKMLIRSKALALLTERGQDISELLKIRGR